jgi:holliday junction DNA helicase RuvA
MITFLRGTVVSALPTSLMIDVAGVGYQVIPTPRALSAVKVGEVLQIDVALVVREDSWTMFGFADPAERSMFEALQKVSGVGPKLALTILAATNPADLARALREGDEAALIRIPGVGKKSAARLILELGDRLPQPPAQVTASSDVVAALVNLGWPSRDAERVVEKVTLQDDKLDASTLLKLALSELSSKRGG